MLTAISLLFLLSTLYGAQSVPPQSCICFNLHNIGPNGTIPCNDTQCSRGDNLTCTATDPDTMDASSAFAFTLYDIPEESYFIAVGCNCPAFKYSYGHGGENGYFNAGGHNDYEYTYRNCSGFNPGTRYHNFTRCCNYCCGPPYVPPRD